MTDNDQLDLTDLEDVLPEAESDDEAIRDEEPIRPPTTRRPGPRYGVIVPRSHTSWPGSEPREPCWVSAAT